MPSTASSSTTVRLSFGAIEVKTDSNDGEGCAGDHEASGIVVARSELFELCKGSTKKQADSGAALIEELLI